ncbi:MAG: hypothetical protein QOJ27_1117 [Sphingomonadales bacterium]|nr:hypothetical protein [Sphingomonadales bacterium]
MPAAAGKLEKMNFSPDDPQALVLVEERDGLRGGYFTFVRVDLEAMTRGTGKIVVDKTTAGRLRTANPGLQTKGEGLMVPKNMSRFSAAKGAPGDYALVDFTYGVFGGMARECGGKAIAVFRFVPGKANLVTAEMLPEGGHSTNILSYRSARNRSNADVADAQEILGEYPNLKGEVVPAEFRGWYQFRKERGGVAVCGKGDFLVPVAAPSG